MGVAMPPYLGSDHPPTADELNDDDDHGDHEQEMDKSACDMHREAEQPQNEKNDGDGPKHGELPCRCRAVRADRD